MINDPAAAAHILESLKPNGHAYGVDPRIRTSATSEKPGEPRKYVNFSRAVYIYGNRNSNPGSAFTSRLVEPPIQNEKKPAISFAKS